MANKDKKTGKWVAQWYEIDMYGKKKRRKKRGFNTMREAKKYESEKTLRGHGDMDMLLKDFVDVYFEDKQNELKARSVQSKKQMMKAHILPYFGDMRMCDITAAQIIKWQNEMYTRDYSASYLRMINNQLTSLFTHATGVYELKDNPCKKVKRMGKDASRSLNFWTIDEYDKFIGTIEKTDRYYIMFELLFWTGIREGELLALTMNDFDFDNNRLHIDKTYYRMDGEDMITSPKTKESVRVVDLPQFLSDEVKTWCDRQYGLPDDIRLFPICARAIQNKMKRHIEKAGVKNIRVHDLRHSHVAYLINQGIEPVLIKDRLGHRDIKITINTYGHLYPDAQKKVADLLDAKRKNMVEKMEKQDEEGLATDNV